MFEKVLAEQPDNLLAMNNLAWLLKDSDNKRALKLAEAAYQRQPQSREIKDTLAQVLKARGGEEDLARAKRLLGPGQGQ